MSNDHATRLVHATPVEVRRVLLEPLALPRWNSAFQSVTGPPKPEPFRSYAIRIRPGLTGTLEYPTITTHRVEITWQMPGFHEIGSWMLEPHGAGGTTVRHEFRHSGPLAAGLRHAYRGVAAVRLRRLAQRVQAESSLPRSAGNPA